MGSLSHWRFWIRWQRKGKKIDSSDRMATSYLFTHKSRFISGTHETNNPRLEWNAFASSLQLRVSITLFKHINSRTCVLRLENFSDADGDFHDSQSYHKAIEKEFFPHSSLGTQKPLTRVARSATGFHLRMTHETRVCVCEFVSVHKRQHKTWT